MFGRVIRAIGSVAIIAMGLYCAYRLAGAFVNGTIYDRAVIAAFPIVTVIVYFVWSRIKAYRTSNS